MEKLQKVLLLRAGVACLAWELRYDLTRLLAAALWLWLNCKFFKSRTAKEVCEAFVVRAKQLSKLLSGKVYLGGSSTKRLAPEQKEGPKQQLKKKKRVRAQSAIKDDDDNNNAEDDNGTRQKVKDCSH